MEKVWDYIQGVDEALRAQERLLSDLQADQGRGREELHEHARLLSNAGDDVTTLQQRCDFHDKLLNFTEITTPALDQDA